MTNKVNESSEYTGLKSMYKNKIKPYLQEYPWSIRITVHKGKPVPVLVVKERFTDNKDLRHNEKKTATATILKDRGLIYSQSLRRCMPVIRNIVSKVCNPAGIPFDLQNFFPAGRIFFRGNLPLDEEAGTKLALIFKLQERIIDMDRVELLAWRVERFSREEAVYWLTRLTQYGPTTGRWAQAGMRIMLGGQPGDKEITKMLERQRR
jgi:hypothetical protein